MSESTAKVEANIAYYQSLLSTATKPTTKNAAIVHAYSYYGWASGNLQDGPTNDAIDTATHLRNLGYEVHMYYMKTDEELLELIKNFVSSELDNFAFYNAGHGSWASVDSEAHNVDEDGTMEYLVLGQRYDGNSTKTPLYDWKIREVMDSYNNSKRLWLMTDACHSGHLFNIKPEDTHIVDITAVTDDSTARQSNFKKQSNRGLFTKFLWETFDRGETNTEYITEQVNVELAQRTQSSLNPIQVCQNHHPSEHFLNAYTQWFNSGYYLLPAGVPISTTQTRVQPFIFTVKDDGGNDVTDREFDITICGETIRFAYAVDKTFRLNGKAMNVIHQRDKNFIVFRDEVIFETTENAFEFTFETATVYIEYEDMNFYISNVSGMSYVVAATDLYYREVSRHGKFIAPEDEADAIVEDADAPEEEEEEIPEEEEEEEIPEEEEEEEHGECNCNCEKCKECIYKKH